MKWMPRSIRQRLLDQFGISSIVFNKQNFGRDIVHGDARLSAHIKGVCVLTYRSILQTA
jgi:hypothetical protein